MALRYQRSEETTIEDIKMKNFGKMALLGLLGLSLGACGGEKKDDAGKKAPAATKKADGKKDAGKASIYLIS